MKDEKYKLLLILFIICSCSHKALPPPKNSENSYSLSTKGYKIHSSCIERWGSNFANFVLQSQARGEQCLQKLARKDKQNIAFLNFQKMREIRNKSLLTLICNETDYEKDWTDTDAHASVNSSREIKYLGVKHPFISLNAELPQKRGTPNLDEVEYLKATLFHESFHNAGYLHVDHIEYAYTCEVCCMQDKLKEEEKKIACKICSTKYQDVYSKNYLSDLIHFSKVNFSPKRAKKAIIEYGRKFPKDRWALFAYADASSDIFSPLGLALINNLMKRFPSTIQDEKIIAKSVIKEFGNWKEFDKVMPYADLAAQMHIEFYFEQNEIKVFKLFDDQDNMIEELRAKYLEAKGNDKYLYRSILEEFKSLLKALPAHTNIYGTKELFTNKWKKEIEESLLIK